MARADSALAQSLPWLIRLRWVTAGLCVLALAVPWSLSSIDIPLRELTLLIIGAAVSNAVAGWWLARGRPMSRLLGASVLGVEMLLLTGLLELTGGPFNPFSVIFVVQVAFAALTLGRLSALVSGMFAAVCYGALIYWHITEVAHGHHRLNDLPSHLLTMWVSIAASAQLAGYFVTQASNAVALRERELEVMRREAAKTERLVSLTTLAAGAAHELSTPLATIAIASREVERALHDGRALTDLADLEDDARLIRTEVDRCQAILDQMSGRAGELDSARGEPVTLAVILADVRARLTPEQSARLRVAASDDTAPLALPRAGLAHAVHALVKNALDASEAAGAPVDVRLCHERDRLTVTVRDAGAAVPPEILERAGEPFFTTKDPGRGLGLGLFLTRVFAERFGGALTLQSQDGTTASLDVPLGPEAAGGA